MTHARMAALALIVALSSPGLALAGQSAMPDAAVLATVNAALDAAQSGDAKAMQAQYLPGCTFVDEFAPFFWSGANSMEAYFASAAEMYKETGMAGTRVSRGKPKYVYVAGTSAYVVIPLKVSAKAKGKPYRGSGSLVFTLRKTDAGWKIASQTWAKDTENINPYK
ncbi:MAG TPA: nuclear transport factor 2 family protein [Gammaproteobacteria bacterium]|nr:nuclear transport factor 2 family protein [Gammaproteobacteria bacterium]